LSTGTDIKGDVGASPINPQVLLCDILLIWRRNSLHVESAVALALRSTGSVKDAIGTSPLCPNLKTRQESLKKYKGILTLTAVRTTQSKENKTLEGRGSL
jgi:hypothetical protein